jgi:hypothetical protein
MKCDELKVYVPQDGPYGLEPEEGGKLVEEETCYLKSDVDAAIAELKDKCQMHDFFWEGCGFAKRGFKNTIAVSEALDELQAENAELKKKLEDVQASHYAEMVDAGMRERRLRRALYNACANWAKCEERINNRDAYDASEYLPSAEDKFRKKAERWSEIERKCRAKAEQYK